MSVTEAKARLSEVLRTVKRGESVAITERGAVIARVVPATEPAVAPARGVPDTGERSTPATPSGPSAALARCIATGRVVGPRGPRGAGHAPREERPTPAEPLAAPATGVLALLLDERSDGR